MYIANKWRVIEWRGLSINSKKLIFSNKRILSELIIWTFQSDPDMQCPLKIIALLFLTAKEEVQQSIRSICLSVCLFVCATLEILLLKGSNQQIRAQTETNWPIRGQYFRSAVSAEISCSSVMSLSTSFHFRYINHLSMFNLFQITLWYII